MVYCIHTESMTLPVSGLGARQVTQAVFMQFTAAEVTQAMAFLQRQGVLNHVGVKRSLELTSAFHSSMQVRRLHRAASAQYCICVPYIKFSGSPPSAFGCLLPAQQPASDMRWLWFRT